LRINREIRAERVRVVTEDGEQLGIMSLREALQKAEEYGVDLIEIAPSADPPVCKVMDYGKFRYHQTKKEKESKKASHQVKVKEVKLKPNIDAHDLLTKIKHMREFLQKGNKVRVTCTFRGREMLYLAAGEKLLERIYEETKDLAVIEAPIKTLGRTMSLGLAPQGKKTKIEKGESSAKDEDQ
jgi:translation initiation factor IF-3